MNSIFDVMKSRPLRYIARSLYERLRETAIARLSTMLFLIKRLMYACSCGKGVVVYGKVVFCPLYANIDIGAGSVVVENIAVDSLAVGNPAPVVKEFTHESVQS